MAERIAIVAHSAITCLGRDMASTWQGLCAGLSGLRRHPRFNPSDYLQDIFGIVEDFGPGSTAEDPAVAKLPARSIHLGLAAARQAWHETGLSKHAINPMRVAVVVGSALGGIDFFEEEEARSRNRRGPAVSPYLIPGLIINQIAGQIAQHLGLLGPSFAPANACATGGHAIIAGALLLRSGMADLAICGAAESAISPLVINGFATMKALLGRKPGDRSLEHPEEASRPFSRDRAGFVLSEGAGMVVLARESIVRDCDLTGQAELAGWACNSDGYHMAMPSSDGIDACLREALRHSSANPADVDYYNAHGTSTVVNDRVETESIKRVFGESAGRLPISSIKGALGHALGAASAIEAAVSVRALLEGVIPPTVHHLPDPELDLDYVPDRARSARLQTVLSASFGFGGTNNALVFRRWKP